MLRIHEFFGRGGLTLSSPFKQHQFSFEQLNKKKLTVKTKR